MAAQQFEFSNFRGGYFTDVPDDLMDDTELRTAENCYWRNGLKKRGGKASYVSFTGALRGGIRAKLASVWYTILAVEPTAGAVELRWGTDTVFTTLSRYDAASTTFTAMTLTNGASVQFAVLDERVVAVNGVDKPSIIYTSASSYLLDTLERYDTRTHDNDSWDAGQVYTTATQAYVTDTTNAQGSTTVSMGFYFGTITISSGFWVGCAHTFNKVTMYDVAASTSFGSLTYQYYGRASSGGATGWIGFTPISVPTFTGVADKIIEMNFPIDSNTNEILVDKVASLNSTVGGVYAMRFMQNNAAASATWACGSLKVEHTQYLTQLCLNDKPDTVATHKSHLFMGMGNWLRHSPRSTLKGWREENKEYFTEGGLIQSMIPHLDYLAVLLDNAIYGISGNSWENFSTQLMNNTKGPINKRSTGLVNEELYFVARDGIYGWNGTRLLKISKHIASDISGYTLTDAAAGNINGEYWVSFPTDSITLIFDPDTYRQDDVGDGRMSFYKFTGYKVNHFLPYVGAGDTGNLMALVFAAPGRLDRLEINTFDKITASSTIPMIIRTRDMPFGNSQQNKIFRRLKIQLGQVTLTGGGVYTIKHYANNSAGQVTVSTQFTAATGSGIDTTYLGIPPGIDGLTYGVYVSHNSQCNAKLLGFSVEVDKRKY